MSDSPSSMHRSRMLVRNASTATVEIVRFAVAIMLRLVQPLHRRLPFIAARRSPHRNPMPPPKLAADAPVLNVRHPVVVNLRPALRMETHQSWSVGVCQRSCRSPSARDGRSRSVLLLHARLAIAPRLGYFKNHCSLRRGSIGTSARSLKPTLFSYGSSFTSAPSSVELFHGHLARLEAVQPAQVRAGQFVHRAVRVA